MFKKIIFIILIIIISGLSAIVSDRYLFPYLSSMDFFARNKWLKKSTQDVTIINRTEQVSVKEETSATKIASQVASSVVNISSYSNTISKTSGKNPSAISKNGTGVIVTSDGIIMTYASAILTDNASYKIILSDGSTYDAQMSGIDSYSNLAFLKINASNLPTVSLGNSDDTEPGEKVIAIGNNLGNYQNRYSSGILNDYNSNLNISGKALSSSEKMEGVFEADFNFADGFVGGPVIDYGGQVIGITGSMTENNVVKYFQIPANKVKLVLNKAIAKELDSNPQLGIYYMPITKSMSLINGLSVEKGAMVYSPSGQQGLAILSGSSAAKAGLRINDIITQVGSDKIDDKNSLPDLLYKHKKGEIVEITVLRDTQEIKISVQL